MVVAVPTNSRVAFSPPALRGCTLVSFASGRDAATSFPKGKSLVGAWGLLGSMVRFFMVVTCF